MRRIAFFVLAAALFLSAPVFCQIDDAYQEFLDAHYAQDLDGALKLAQNLDAQKYPQKWAAVALTQLRKHQPDDALATLKNAGQQTGELGNYLKFLEAESYMLQMKPDDALEAIRVIQESVLTPFLVLKLRLQLVDYYLHYRDLQKAQYLLDLLEKPLGEHVDPFVQSEILRRRIEMALDQHQVKVALKLYGQWIQSFPEQDEDQRVWRRLGGAFSRRLKIYEALPEFTDQLIYLQGLAAAGSHGKVVLLAQNMARKFPSAPELYRVNELMGVAYFHLYQFQKALPVLKQAVLFAPSLSSVLKARYYLARCYERTRDYLSAEKSYLEIIADKTTDEYKPEAYYFLCRILQRLGDEARYNDTLAAFQKEFGDHGLSKRLLWEQQWEAIRKAAGADQKTMFEQAVGDPPLFAKLMRFYHQAVPEMDHDETQYLGSAIQKYPLSFYALQVLKIDQLQGHGLATRNILAKDPAVQKYMALYAMGLADLGLDEIAYLRAQKNHWEQPLLYSFLYLNVEKGVYHQALDSYTRSQTAVDKLIGDIPDQLAPLLYPRAFWPIVKNYADKYELDPYLALAVMREESHFNPRARSRTGAMGLMQLMPHTARDLSRRLGERWKGNPSLAQPDVNIRLGVWYLEWLSKKFNGNVHYVLSAYNGGPNATLRWIQLFGTTDLEAFARQIRYQETQDYIRRVTDTYLIYKIIYS